MEMGILVLFIVLIGAIIWRISKSRSPQEIRPTTPSDNYVAPIQLKVSSSMSVDLPKSATGAINQSVDGGWILNPQSSFPLTIYGITQEGAKELKQMLDNNSAMDHTGRNRPLVALIAHSNLHCKEIDDYVKEFKPKYQRKLRELAASSREWASASAIDREDLMIEYRQQAIASLDVQPYCDSENLFEGEPADITLDDALIDRFGFDTMSFYLGRATNLDKIHRVPADHYDRAGFEKLVDLGLAVRGTAIPLPTILMKLTLKEMRELVSDLAAPSFRKKAQAIDFILALPDTQDRVGRAIPFRALFKLNALPPQFSGVDLTQVASSWSYAAEIAFILAHTYRFVHYQANTSESDNQLNHLDSFMKGWKILATTNSCPCCLRAAKKRFPRT